MIREGYKRLGDYIEPVDERNSDLSVKLSQGICNNKYFITPRQVAENSANDKIVRKGQFAYNRATTRNGDKISIAYREGDDCTVSSAYQIFRIVDEEKLNPYYLWMWFRRPEFDRYARFKSRGSAHEFFEWDEMCEVYLPVPDIATQRRIVAEYQAVEKRIVANEQLISKLEDTAQTIYKKVFVDNIDPEHLPDGWTKKTISDFCNIFTGKKDVNQASNSGQYRFFSCSPERYFSDEAISNGPAILIAGNGSYTGRVSFYNKPFDLYQRTYACTEIDTSKNLLGYLYCVLKFSFENKFMGGSRGSSIPYIVRGDIADFPVIYNDEVSSKVSKQISVILNYEMQLLEEISTLSEIRETLLSKIAQ